MKKKIPMPVKSPTPLMGSVKYDGKLDFGKVLKCLVGRVF
jgi:hypothetical protein